MKNMKLVSYSFLLLVLFFTINSIQASEFEHNAGVSTVKLEIVEEYIDSEENEQSKESYPGENGSNNNWLPQTGEQLVSWIGFIGLVLCVIVIWLKKRNKVHLK
ncbi:MAG: LPXTG cell wall anchor domain-containing protein [Vagococcus sp.]|uniref:LPXTG cell wall anchor domain-containing protein n=1 Tax=Vagococcus sp. TaxID=1933889 RepID=UPI002FCC8E4B